MVRGIFKLTLVMKSGNLGSTRCWRLGSKDLDSGEVEMKKVVVSLLVLTALVSGLTHSYISFPRTAMYLRLPQSADTNNTEVGVVKPLPTTIVGLVELQISALIGDGRRFDIDAVAESLAISRRLLQRAIAGEGFTYLQVLNDIRFRQAISWLDFSDRSVTEISLALGYTDPSNFARAFRRHTGLSPRALRDAKLHRL